MERTSNIIESNGLVEKTLYLTIAMSGLSQLPFFAENQSTQLMAYSGWIIFAVCLILSKRLFLSKEIVHVFFAIVVMCAILLVVSLFTGKSYFNSSMLYSLFISFLIMVLGNICGDLISDYSLNRAFFIYIISSFVVAVTIFIQYFGFSFDLTGRGYLYGSKNSFAQILLTSVTTLIIIYHPEKRFWRWFKTICLVFELFMIVVLKSRATILSTILCLLLIVLASQLNRKMKYVICSAGTLIILVLFVNEELANNIINNILFAGRNLNDINDLSSGRYDIIKSFPYLLKDNVLFGIGATYFECFPLSAVLQFGIIGGLTTIIISLLPLFKSYINRKRNKYWMFLFIISAGYAMNGLFEGLTPLGPGIKCYFLWLMYGIFLKRKGYDILEN